MSPDYSRVELPQTLSCDGVPLVSVQDLKLGFGTTIVQHSLTFEVRTGSIFAIMGASGCGKSTVLKSMIGLQQPLAGSIRVCQEDYWSATADRRAEIGRRFGVLFQSSALWSALTVGENVALPLEMFTSLDENAVRRLVRLKLALVDMELSVDARPAELSGGMSKRAGLARALALDPMILFLDEPSAGLDPVTASRLDELIMDLRAGFGVTVVLVSHDLASLFAIADDGIFLDAKTKTAIAHGSPAALRDTCEAPAVQAFMRRQPFGAQKTEPILE